MNILERPIAILGAGSWGTALANSIAYKGHMTVLIDRDYDRARAMSVSRENARFLPGIMLSPNVDVTTDTTALSIAAAILFAAPAQQLRATLKQVAKQIPFGTPVIVCAKGIERGTGQFMCDIVAQEVPAAIPCILSGPSFAVDVARVEIMDVHCFISRSNSRILVRKRNTASPFWFTPSPIPVWRIRPGREASGRLSRLVRL